METQHITHLLAHAHGDDQVGDEHDAVRDDHDKRDDRAAHGQVLGQGDALPVNQAVEAGRVGAFRAEDARGNEAWKSTGWMGVMRGTALTNGGIGGERKGRTDGATQAVHRKHVQGIIHAGQLWHKTRQAGE